MEFRYRSGRFVEIEQINTGCELTVLMIPL